MALQGAVWAAEGRDGPFSGMDLTVCFYCGAPADSIDHVVPKSLLRDLADDPQAQALLTARGRILEVDCCRQCNSLLGSDYDQTLAERKARLRRRLRRRYARLLDMPDWTDSELGHMGRYLQQYILAHSAQRDWVRERLTYDGPATRHGVRLHVGQPPVWIVSSARIANPSASPARVSLGRSRHVSLEQGLELMLHKAEQIAARWAS